MLLKIQVEGDYSNINVIVWRKKMGLHPPIGFSPLLCFMSLVMIMWNPCQLPYLMCKIMLCYVLNIMHDVLIWIMNMVVAINVFLCYEHNLEFMINWWIWMIIDAYVMFSYFIICILFFGRFGVQWGQNRSFEWAPMVKMHILVMHQRNDRHECDSRHEHEFFRSGD